MIPKILHYCFGLSPDFGGKPWSLIHHVCVKSAIRHIQPSEVVLYCEYEPSGPWWELTRRLLSVRKIQAPREILGNPLHHPAHRADVVRLEKLLSVGGIYLDADVFVHKSFDPLLHHSVVLGEERVSGEIVGLCNAVMLAEAGAPFLQRWRSTYRYFRSRGHDEYWDEHSVRMPYGLSQEFPSELTTLPPSAFFWPTFTTEDLGLIFDSPEPLDLCGAYATHLWESPAWERYLEHLTPGRVRAVDSNFHYWARPLLDGVPDNFGRAATAHRLGHGARQFGRRVRSLFNRMKPSAPSQSH